MKTKIQSHKAHFHSFLSCRLIFITKPFRSAEVVVVIAHLLNSRHRSRSAKAVVSTLDQTLLKFSTLISSTLVIAHLCSPSRSRRPSSPQLEAVDPHLLNSKLSNLISSTLVIAHLCSPSRSCRPSSPQLEVVEPHLLNSKSSLN
ncbi:hypothetical protein Sjap_021903 [Stephania japonica]|uniref:Uncharacterized protein n=1 Tax=Stephania japonica TaxID=461633 RepID=A0AAP0HTX1_9MAGN